MKKAGIVLVLSAAVFMLVTGMQRGSQQSAVDYSNEANWAALPWKKDSADVVPASQVHNGQDSALVDVFYIYPTTYLVGIPWNADINDESINKRTDNGAVKQQATAFNGSCKVYAPRYRQAVLRSFFADTKDTRKALDLAYSDVKAAFQYYLDHYNHGRPVIIAGHSQGARHAMLLLKEFFDNKPLKDKLVAAYPVGMYFKCDTLKSIPICSGPGQAGTYATWNTFHWGSELMDKQKQYKGSCCVNPITWTQDEAAVPSSLHKGSIPLTFDRIDAALVSTQKHGSVLWCERPQRDGYMLLATGESYHVGDISLFWMDIRQNVALQVKNYFEKSK